MGCAARGVTTSHSHRQLYSIKRPVRSSTRANGRGVGGEGKVLTAKGAKDAEDDPNPTPLCVLCVLRAFALRISAP